MSKEAAAGLLLLFAGRVRYVSGQFVLSSKCGGTFEETVTLAGKTRGVAGIIPAGKRNLKIQLENLPDCDSAVPPSCTAIDTDLEIFLQEDPTQAIFADYSDVDRTDPSAHEYQWPDPLFYNTITGASFSKAFGGCLYGQTANEMCFVYSGYGPTDELGQQMPEYFQIPGGKTTKPLLVGFYCYTTTGCKAKLTYIFEGLPGCVDTGFGEASYSVPIDNSVVQIANLPQNLQNVFVTVEPDLSSNVNVNLIVEDRDMATSEFFISPSNDEAGLTTGKIYDAVSGACNMEQDDIDGISFVNSNIAIPSANKDNQRTWQGTLKACHSGYNGKPKDLLRGQVQVYGSQFFFVHIAKTTQFGGGFSYPAIARKGDFYEREYDPHCVPSGKPTIDYTPCSNDNFECDNCVEVDGKKTGSQMDVNYEDVNPKYATIARQLTLSLVAPCCNDCTDPDTRSDTEKKKRPLCESNVAATGKIRYSFNVDLTKKLDPNLQQYSCTASNQPVITRVHPSLASAGSVIEVWGDFPLSQFEDTKFFCEINNEIFPAEKFKRNGLRSIYNVPEITPDTFTPIFSDENFITPYDKVYCKVPSTISPTLVGTPLRVNVINVPKVELDQTTGFEDSATFDQWKSNPLCRSRLANSTYIDWGASESPFSEALTTTNVCYESGSEYAAVNSYFKHECDFFLEKGNSFVFAEEVDTVTFPGCLLSLAERCAAHTDGIWQLRWTSDSGRLGTIEPCDDVECVMIRSG